MPHTNAIAPNIVALSCKVNWKDLEQVVECGCGGIECYAEYVTEEEKKLCLAIQ